jgi:putative transcriptional regulator
MKDLTFIFPKTITGEDLRTLRKKLGFSQREFALYLGVSKSTVERWEGKNETLTGPVVTLYDYLSRDSRLAEKAVLPERTMPMRLLYYCGNMLCTVIDVNEAARRVEIRDYVSNPLYRAFGINNDPTYEEYEEFLRSRCFPETRDKIKFELQRLGIPFYDPLLIIEKTEGRMADDSFWIRIERNRVNTGHADRVVNSAGS